MARNDTLKTYRGKRDLRRSPEPKGRRRLLVKMDDEGADRRRNPLSSQPESALSGGTIEELEKPG